MNHHIGDTNKMSETPISDSTPHNVADLGMQIRKLERQLNAANERIKRMEEAGDAVAAIFGPPGSTHWADENQMDAAWNNWTKAKEAKL